MLPPRIDTGTQRCQLRFVPPPYEELEGDEGGASEVVPGTLAILRLEVSDPRVSLEPVRPALQRSGSFPLILEFAPFPPSPTPTFEGAAFLDLARRAGLRGVRLIALSPLKRRELRERLTSTVGLMGPVKQWVRRSHPHLGEDEVGVVVQYLAEGANDEDGFGLGLIPERTARGILSRSHLPPPVRLRAIGRLLRPILSLRGDPERTLASVASSSGTSVHSLRTAVRRTLGVGILELRKAWGPEKVLHLGFKQGK
jgi:hypothetical protein